MAKDKKVEKKEELKEVVQEVAPKKGDREKRWKLFLDAAQVQNPVKYEIKEKNGEFKAIPKSFS